MFLAKNASLDSRCIAMLSVNYFNFM